MKKITFTFNPQAQAEVVGEVLNEVAKSNGGQERMPVVNVTTDGGEPIQLALHSDFFDSFVKNASEGQKYSALVHPAADGTYQAATCPEMC